MDIFDRIRNDRGPLGQHAKNTHGYFTFPKLEGDISNRMMFRGKEVLVWSINNYLGLANHPDVRKADADAAKDWGMGYPMGARMMSGQTKFHEELEENLADFMQKEDAFLLNFGYQGCQSAIEALVSRHDVIVYDSESHACMVDGVRLHQGKRFVFQHNDMALDIAQKPSWKQYLATFVKPGFDQFANDKEMIAKFGDAATAGYPYMAVMNML